MVRSRLAREPLLLRLELEEADEGGRVECRELAALLLCEPGLTLLPGDAIVLGDIPTSHTHIQTHIHTYTHTYTPHTQRVWQV